MALVGLFAGATVYGGREDVNSNSAITGDFILLSRVRLGVEPSSCREAGLFLDDIGDIHS